MNKFCGYSFSAIAKHTSVKFIERNIFTNRMSDATPAYRGYRLQALYALARILDSEVEGSKIFRPEGAEDLAILGQSNVLTEIIQVKAYSTNLSLSTFKPDKPGSFLYRANKFLAQHPDLEIVIASFGNIGPELLSAIQENGVRRQTVAQKIHEYGFLSREDAEQLLDRLQIVSVAESELEQAVFTTLSGLCTGVDQDSAFDLLNFWLYLCSENQTQITQEDLIQRINDVGRFTAEREAFHGEWFRSIVPIVDHEIGSHERAQLEDEFYRGISARYEHIVAEVDKPRINKLNEIAHKFEENQVVIVHGASGQGKTTIAYRYLRDFFPDQWRFQVKLVENRRQALNIATALAGQAKAIGIPIAVYLDVSPNDIGWDELVKQLALQKNINVLVTVREEDFRRASISGTEIQFAEIELKFEQQEAEEIYQFLAQSEIPDQFLDFDDAWNRFGRSGPLMEFVYLITQGNSLRERLQQQVRRIQDEIRGGHFSSAELDLLRLVAVASSSEARLKVRELASFLDLPSPDRTLELLEEEYLLRTSEGGTLVEGLHPIRSAILTDILTDQAFYSWSSTVSVCLPFIFEQDISSFLLYSFLRPTHELEPLLSELDRYQPHRWVAISGSIRALIWLGIKEYVEENHSLIEEAYEEFNHAWAFVLNFDIADVSPDTNDIWTSSLSHLMTEENLARIAVFRERQTARERIFTRASEWISNLVYEPSAPQSDLDWAGLSDSLFWKGRLQATSPMLGWLERIDVSRTIDDLPLEILADLLLGLFYANESVYRSFLEINYNNLIRKFRRETQTFAWEDRDQNIRAHYAINIVRADRSLSKVSQKNAFTPKYYLNASMERLDILRKIFPDRAVFGSNGYGHLIWINTDLPDETQKNIPRQNYPISKLVELNATFRALGKKSLRPMTWEDYSQAVIQLRQIILRVLEQITQGLSVFFIRQGITRVLGGYVDSELWIHAKQLLSLSPSLPECAFDKWGFIAENVTRNTEPSDDLLRQNLAAEKYDEYLDLFNGYVRTLSNFLNQAEWPLNVHPYTRNHGLDPGVQNVLQDSGVDVTQQSRLSVLNLADAWKLLSGFQIEFRKLLIQFVDEAELAELERNEKRIFKLTWCSWYFFAFYPEYDLQDSIREFIQLFTRKTREIKGYIQRNLSYISSDLTQIEILSDREKWHGKRSLWISIDGEDVFEVYRAIEAVVVSIQEAINLANDDELRRYAIDLAWSNIVVLPLIRGKSLDLKAWNFSSILFSADPNREFSQASFVQVEIPPDTVSHLTLETWEHPRLSLIREFVGSISQLTLLSAHIKDFDRMPDLDEQGEELFQQYLQDLSPLFSDAFKTLIKTISGIYEYYSGITDSELEDRPFLIDAIQSFAGLYGQLLPIESLNNGDDAQMSMNLREMTDWVNNLSAAQQATFEMYSSWVSDVLAEIAIA
jgi:DNA polymerase III delta prime subunit